MNGLRVGIVGVTGAVGRVFLDVLAQRNFPVAELRPLASARSAGRTIDFRGEALTVREATPQALDGLDLVFTTATSAVSLALAPEAVARGAVVIDDGSAYRMDPQVPLVVPEVNAEDVDWHRGILSTPNCTTVPLVMVLGALHRTNPAERVIVATYQAVSGTGAQAVDELLAQERALAKGEPIPAPSVYPRQIARNALPHVDAFDTDGYTKEELKMRNETRKILAAPGLAMTATCVRIPVTVSHSEAVTAQFRDPVTVAQFRAALAGMPGVRVVDDPATATYPVPLDAEGVDDVLVGRIRPDQALPGAIACWITCDNVRKGAAVNAVQIAETLIARDRLRVPAGS